MGEKGFFGFRGNISCCDFNGDVDNKIHNNANDHSDCSPDDIDNGSIGDIESSSFRISDFDYATPLACVHNPLPVELLLVCDQIHNEAVEILYGEHVFYLDCYDQRAVCYLINLNHWALASLRMTHVCFGHEDETTSGHLRGTNPLLYNQAAFPAGQQQWTIRVRLYLGHCLRIA